MKRHEKLCQIIAWVAMLATVVVMLFSTLYLVEHENHVCSGQDCPICAVMEQCSHNLKTIGAALILVCTGLFLSFSMLQENYFEQNSLVGRSLISQKVRLNP